MIIDACMFLNEHELFDFRVQELDSVVDLFVVVEAGETFTGMKRDYQFKAEGPKIRYVVLPELVPHYTDQASGWDREAYQRDFLLRAATNLGAQPDDVLIVSDCDEVPRAKMVKATIPKLVDGIHRFDVDCYYYNIKNFVGNTHYSTVIGTVAQFEKAGGTQAARKRIYDDRFIVREAGWHFSYWGGVERMREKVKAFAHANDEMCQRFLQKSDEEIRADIEAHRNIYYPTGGEFFEPRGLGDWRLPTRPPKEI